MGFKRLLTGLFLLFFSFAHTTLNAKVYHDTEDSSLKSLFIWKNTKYVVRYQHVFEDTLIIPDNSEIYFDGGSLSGPIVFNNSYLTGKVNLKGSNISGNIKNKEFEALWICAADGITDDAPVINNLISSCDCIHFSKGKYRLISTFLPSKVIPQELHSELYAHIGINRSGVKLLGEDGAEFVSNEPCGTIIIYSVPYQIENSCSNIEIVGLKFSVNNDGTNFNEFMHTIKMIGVDGLTIENCTFNDFWGDAICLSHFGDNPQTGERTRNQNVKILNNIIVGGDHHSNRNGISVINGKNVLIKNNIIRNTSRKDMPGGIDVEPNNSAYTIENLRILDNSLEKIRTNAIQVYIPKGSPAHNIAIKRNTVKSSGNGIYIGINSDNTTDNLTISNNIIDSNTNPYCFDGNGLSNKWTICGNTFDRPCRQVIPGNIKVANLVVKNNKKKQ